MVSNRNLLLQTSIFRCYVSCREGTTRVATKSTRKQCSLCALKYQDVFLTEMMWNLVESFVQLPLGNTCPDTHRMRWCKSLALLLSQYFCPRPRLPAVQQPGCRLFNNPAAGCLFQNYSTPFKKLYDFFLAPKRQL